MKRHLVLVVMLIALSLVMSGCFLFPKSQEPVVKVNVQGVIVDNSGDVSDLTVTLDGQSTDTSADGTFEFEDIRSGNRLLTVYRDEQGIHSETVTIANTDTIIEIELYVTNWTHEVGEWEESFEDGIFLMKNSDIETGTTNAYAEIEQSGKKLVYEWSMKEQYGGSTGVHILAQSGTDSAHHGGSYLIFHSGNTLQLYRTIEGKLDGIRWSESVPKGSLPINNYRVEVDTETGVIDIHHNDNFIGTWTDTDPYVSGEYIALRTNKTEATFSKIKVTVLE